VSLMEQELLTLPEHLSSPQVFSGVRVTRSLVLYVCFVDRCLSFCTFSFGHCVVCSSSIYGLWLPLWYLQTLIIKTKILLHYALWLSGYQSLFKLFGSQCTWQRLFRKRVFVLLNPLSILDILVLCHFWMSCTERKVGRHILFLSQHKSYNI
jgi:hypothetical protein